MAGTIMHEWNGTILTITSDSGTSSMDLKGGKGDLGPRGPQGPAGVIINPDGTINWNGYATEQYVNDKIAELDMSDIELDNYYTKEETLLLIPDTADFATKAYVDSAVENIEVVGGKDGKDGISATHSWNGTVLTITSASGTSSADLKGQKGDKGETGPKGDSYTLTSSDKTEIANLVLSSLPNGNEVYY